MIASSLCNTKRSQYCSLRLSQPSPALSPLASHLTNKFVPFSSWRCAPCSLSASLSPFIASYAYGCLFHHLCHPRLALCWALILPCFPLLCLLTPAIHIRSILLHVSHQTRAFSSFCHRTGVIQVTTADYYQQASRTYYTLFTPSGSEYSLDFSGGVTSPPTGLQTGAEATVTGDGNCLFPVSVLIPTLSYTLCFSYV